MATLSRTVQSVDRALMLLRTVADSDTPLSVADLAVACGLERPTAWRLLWTLETNGLIEKVEPGHHYRVTVGSLGLAGRQTVDSLARIARPVLDDLAARWEVTASLALVERFTVGYVDQVDGPLFSSPRWEGRALSLHASSPGKAVLAALPPAERRGMLGPSLERLTDTTIVSLDALDAELETVRRNGYAVSSGEDVTYSNGASAVVMVGRRPLAAVNLWGPERLVPPSRLTELGTAAAGAARELAALLDPAAPVTS